MSSEKTLRQMVEARRAFHRAEILRLDAMGTGLRESAESEAGSARRRTVRLVIGLPVSGQRTFLEAEVIARRTRGKLIQELRSDAGLRGRLGGADFAIVLIEEGVSGNGDHRYTRRSLEAIAEGFEGAALVVREGQGLFDHRSDTALPYSMRGDARAESGFVHALRVGDHEGKAAVLGQLHVFESAADVRDLIRRRPSLGLSVEAPSPDGIAGSGRPPPKEPAEVLRFYHALPSSGGAEDFTCVALVTYPAAGGRILGPAAVQLSETTWQKP